MSTPETAPQEATEVLPQLSPEEEQSLQIEKEVDRRLSEERTRIVTETKRLFQTQLEVEVQMIKKRLEDQNRETIEKAVEEFKKQQAPPTPDEVQKILDAEYLTFPLKIRWSGKVEIEEIELRELPAAVERKIVRLIKEKARPVIEKIAPALLEVMQGTGIDKLTAVFELIDPASDIVLEIVTLILSETTGRKITKETVEKSLSFNRQVGIITAQMECNRLRDFFSRAVRIAGS